MSEQHKNRLVALLADMTNPPLDAINQHFKSKYSSLAAILNHVKPIMAKHGAVISQDIKAGGDEVAITTSILFDDAVFHFGPMALKHDGNVQHLGSIVTYLRRYSICGALSIFGDEDTDGNFGAGGSDKTAASNRAAQGRPAVGSSANRPSPVPASSPAAGKPALPSKQAEADEAEAMARDMGWPETDDDSVIDQRQTEAPPAGPTPTKATAVPDDRPRFIRSCIPSNPLANRGEKIGWKEVKIHFGKNKGVALGTMTKAKINWYVKEWTPKEWKGKFSEADMLLDYALHLASQEIVFHVEENKGDA